jgi:hypothetical protein
MYKYFLSYAHRIVGSNSNGNGFGNCDVQLNHKIKGIKDSAILEEKIKEDVKNTQDVTFAWVKIINFIRIK